jgi:rod shape determining protein RodA
MSPLTNVSAQWRKKTSSIDWLAFLSAVVLGCLGLLTMNSFTGQDPFFVRQVVWLVVGIAVFFTASGLDWRFLRRSGVSVGIYAALLVPLIFLIVAGTVVQGARSWFDLGPFALQPVEFVKLSLIILLAKYFSRRHIEIRNIRHIFISGAYAALVFVLVALQPDFGSAIIIALIWFGMVMVSGLSRRHLFAVIALGTIAFSLLWGFGFQDYQKQRIMTFLHPLADIHGAGYNAYQSTVAVGSGELLGKGIGYGTQSKLRFLPEYQTDFIFAAFAEEWGFVGIVIVFVLYGVIFWRILQSAMHGASNFETLFALGILCYFVAHFTLHVGINLGLLPVTGTTIPFMSYGGSHLLAEFLALGILSGMRAYGRAIRPDALSKEFSGGYDR